MSDFETLRYKMVKEQLIPRGIQSNDVLQAMRNVPRHLFVPEALQANAYDDSPLPIGFGQTISQPYIVAYMTEQLKAAAGMKILEIGTGSAYQAAILAYLEAEVYTIELVKELFERAEKTISQLKYNNVKTQLGNGYLGWPEYAPFDAIIVTAAPERIPEKLLEQLKEGGSMIIPVGNVHSVQWLKLVTKTPGNAGKSGGIVEFDKLPVRFVPMVK